MQDLRLVGIHEDGEHLLLSDEDGQRFRVPVDAALREAVRRERPRGDGSPEGAEPEPMRPRDVQSLIRSGASVDEVAERSGWDVEKVRRYEPPIRAERDYVASLARAVELRGRSHGEVAPTLGTRVIRRLTERGVDMERVSWDAWKDDETSWLVVALFPAGGRERRASWRFAPTDRTLIAADDEARWLGEDEQASGPLPAPAIAPSGRNSTVYDVEAEGGVAAAVRARPSGKGKAGQPGQAEPGQGGTDRPDAEGEARGGQRASGEDAGEGDEAVDLMSAMRQRAATRKRRPSRKRPAPTDTPIAPEDMPEQARPVERLRLADAPEPPHGSHARPEELDGPPEDELDQRAGDDDTAELDVVDRTEELEVPDLADGAGDGADDDTDEAADAGDDVDGQDGPRHDPVTGTADLFDDLEAVSDSRETKQAAKPKRSRRRRATKRAGEPEVEQSTSTDDDAADERSGRGYGEASSGDPDAATSKESTSDDAAGQARGTDEAKGSSKGASKGAETAARDADEGPSAAESVPQRSSGARRGRPSVPSWDDIMFGSRPRTEE